MAEKWYDKSVVQTASLLGTDMRSGLDRESVRKRRRLDGENDIYPTPKKSFKQYVAHLLTDYTTLLMLITLLIAAIFEETENLYVMLAILATYYIIVMVTYVKSQKVLEDMGRSALPNAKVLREGRVFMVKQKQLVRGDVIYVSAGDIVPCDARLIETDDLEVLEVNVTGVTHAVRKNAKFEEYHDIAPAQQKNMLFASSIVTKGTATAICCEIGTETLVSVMGKNQPIVSHERLRVFDRIGRFCKRWTLIMTMMVLALTVTDLLLGNIAEQGLFGSFMTGLSIAVSSMSEFYTAFAYIVLACGIFGAVNRKDEVNRGALIKNSAKLEEVKNLTCLIVPKEAGFNIRDMSLGKVFANGDNYAPGDRGYRRNAARVLRYALISTGRYDANQMIANNTARDNIYSSEEEAIIKAAEACREYNIGLDRRYPMLQHLRKGGESPFETTLVRYENGFVVSLRGDYNDILPRCRYYTEDSRVYTMTEEKRNEFYIAAERLTRESYRVIAVASKDTVYNNLKRLSVCQTDITLEGLIAIREPVLPDAAKNLLRCRGAGLKVIMLTPDSSENNRILAESLGIALRPDQIISGRELATMKEGLIRANLDQYTVYEGLNLAQKRLLVRFLQEKGEKVGYLCSELDEIILMKDADVGFSRSVTISEHAEGGGVDLSRHNIPIYVKDADRGGYGCEALKFVSDVIVSEPDKSGSGGFNAMLEAVLCSKAVYYNMHRMLRYMISSQLAKLLIVFASSFLGITLLTPPQILFVGLIIDFAAMITIAFEKPDPSLLKVSGRVSERLDRPLLKNPEAALFGLLWAAATVFTADYMMLNGWLPTEALPTFGFVSFLVGQVSLLNECKREQSLFDKNVRVNGAYLMMLSVLVLCVTMAFVFPSFGAMFGIVRVSYVTGVAVLIPALCLTVVYEIYKAIINRAEKKSSVES